MGENQYSFVEITKRKCSPNLQKDIKEGDIYSVVGTDTLKDGTSVIIVKSEKAKGKTLRINANRFSWKSVSVKEMAERKFKESCQNTSEQLRTNFTQKEHLQIAFIPCILADIAFRYGDKVRKTAAEMRISELKHLSRAYDTLKEAYLKDLSLDLDNAHIKEISEQTSVFMALYAKDFQILWFSVSAELTRKYSEYPYREMRTDAICGMFLIDMAREMISGFDKMIQQRIPNMENTIFNPKVAALRDVLDAYAGKVDNFDFSNQNCKHAAKVIHNRIMQIEFNVE